MSQYKSTVTVSSAIIVSILAVIGLVFIPNPILAVTVFVAAVSVATSLLLVMISEQSQQSAVTLQTDVFAPLISNNDTSSEPTADPAERPDVVYFARVFKKSDDGVIADRIAATPDAAQHAITTAATTHTDIVHTDKINWTKRNTRPKWSGTLSDFRFIVKEKEYHTDSPTD